MLAVRYVTLVALVVWLGGLVALRLLAAPASETFPQFEFVEYACGAVLLGGLLVLKFVGPPPAGFIPRMALVSVMLATAVSADFWNLASTMPQTAEIVLGLALLSWYVRE
jgi:hypothetical protein